MIRHETVAHTHTHKRHTHDIWDDVQYMRELGVNDETISIKKAMYSYRITTPHPPTSATYDQHTHTPPPTQNTIIRAIHACVHMHIHTHILEWEQYKQQFQSSICWYRIFLSKSTAQIYLSHHRRRSDKRPRFYATKPINNSSLRSKKIAYTQYKTIYNLFITTWVGYQCVVLTQYWT